MQELKYQDEIELYLSGKGDKQAFERQLEENSELRAEYESRLAAKQAAEFLAFEQLNEELNHIREDRSRRVLGMPPNILKYAAIVLFIVGVGTLWYSNATVGNATLAEANYFEPDFGNVRSDSKPERFDLASQEYYLKNYKQAAASLENIKADDSTFIPGQYLLGHTYFKLGNYFDASRAFQVVANDADSEFRQAAEWHLILTYLKSDNLVKANQGLDQILQDSNHPYYEKASKLKTKLQSIWRNFVF